MAGQGGSADEALTSASERGGQLGRPHTCLPSWPPSQPCATSEDVSRRCRDAARNAIVQGWGSTPGDGSVQTSSGESEDGLDLFPCHWKLLDHLVDGHAVFQVLEDNRHGCACALEQPGPTDLAWGTFHDRALGQSSEAIGVISFRLLPAYGISPIRSCGASRAGSWRSSTRKT